MKRGRKKEAAGVNVRGTGRAEGNRIAPDNIVCDEPMCIVI